MCAHQVCFYALGCVFKVKVSSKCKLFSGLHVAIVIILLWIRYARNTMSLDLSMNINGLLESILHL